jgi:hypothetical protein
VSRPRAGRLLLALAVTLGLLVLTPSPSWACSCAATSTAEHVQQAGTVAAGTVDWTATDGQTRTYKVDFDAVYKGVAAGSEKLRTSAYDASCGLGDLATDRRYLFFIEGRHPGTMRVGLCGGTVPYDDAVAREVEQVTGPPGKPLSAPTVESPADSSGGGADPLLVLGLGAAALLAIAGGAVVLRRRAL